MLFMKARLHKHTPNYTTVPRPHINIYLAHLLRQEVSYSGSYNGSDQL